MTDEPPKLHSVILSWMGPGQSVVLERSWEYLPEDEGSRYPLLFLEQDEFCFLFDDPSDRYVELEDVSLPETDDDIVVRALWYRSPGWAEDAARWCFMREVKRRGIDLPELPYPYQDLDRSVRREQPVRAFDQRG